MAVLLLVVGAMVIVVLALSARRLMEWARILYFAGKLPGPKPHPLMGNLNVLLTPPENFLPMFGEIFAKYKFFHLWGGPVPHVIIREPEHIKIVLGDSKCITKTFHYDLLHIGKGLFVLPETAMANPSNSQDIDGDDEFVTYLKKTLDELFIRLRSPWFYSDFTFLRSRGGKLGLKFLEMLEDRSRKMAVLLLIGAVVIVVLALSARRLMEWARILYFAWKLPGPKAHPIMGNLNILLTPAEDVLPRFQEIFEKYKFFHLWAGPVPHVFIRDPEHLKIVLGDSKCVTKTFHYDLLHLGTGLFVAPDEAWKVHRKLLNPTFTITVLERFVEVFCVKSEILVKKLEKEATGQPFNIHQYIFKCAMDMLWETAMANPSNSQDIDGDDEFVTYLKKTLDELFIRLRSPWFYSDFTFLRSRGGKLGLKFLEMLEDRSRKAMTARKKSYEVSKEEFLNSDGKKKMTFVDALLDGLDNQKKLTESDVLDEIKAFTIAGHDTTTGTVCWALQLLGNHPDIQDKVHEELDSIFQGSDRPPTMKDANDMKYLERVIKETTRLYPSLPLIARKLNKDIEIDGHSLPAGMNVIIMLFFAHRTPEWFPDPEKFNPDNFLPEKEANRHPYAWVPFGGGPRNCIGMKYAMLEMKMLLSYLMRNYTVRSVKEKLTIIPQVTISSKEGFPLCITKRNVKSVK